jgi:hypothetical protein
MSGGKAILATGLTLTIAWMVASQMGFATSAETAVRRVERLALQTHNIRTVSEPERAVLIATIEHARAHCRRSGCDGVLAERYHAATLRLAGWLDLPFDALALESNAGPVLTGSVRRGDGARER